MKVFYWIVIIGLLLSACNGNSYYSGYSDPGSFANIVPSHPGWPGDQGSKRAGCCDGIL